VSVNEGEWIGKQAARRRIVIIDDDDAIVETLEEVLEAEGCDVQGYTDPIQALEELRTHAWPDVIILDCVMPTMDGPRVMAALAAEGSTVPIILVTALSDPGFCIDPSNPHAARIINKPFDLEQLLETLDEVMSEPARAADGGRARARPATVPE
jgi:DNA-binding NtrC family response regulator